MPGAWGRGNEDLTEGEGGGRSEAAEKEERRRGGRGGGGGGDVGQGYGVQTSLRYVSMYRIMMAYMVDHEVLKVPNIQTPFWDHYFIYLRLHKQLTSCRVLARNLVQ